MLFRRNKKGLTLQELVFAVTLMMVLIGVVIILIDPPVRFKQAREAQRFADVYNIMDAIRLHQIDSYGGTFIGLGLLDPDQYYMIGTCESGSGTECAAVQTGDDCVDLNWLVDAEYLDDVPSDPKIGSREKTQYFLRQTITNRVIVGACEPELSLSIRRSF